MSGLINDIRSSPIVGLYHAQKECIIMRKNFWSLAGLTASLLAGSAIAQTSPSGRDSWFDGFGGGQWYVGGSAGGNWVGRHTKLERFDLSSPVRTKATYDDGFIGS